MRALAWLLVAGCALPHLAACGRVRFDDLAGDGRAGDDAPGGDAAPACLASYRLCDGFEGSYDPAWIVDPGVVLDSSVAHRGAFSVHVHVDQVLAGTQKYLGIDQRATLPLGDNPVYVRAWFRLSALPATNNRMEIINARQSTTGNGDVLFVHDIEMALYSQFSAGVRRNGTPPPTNTWVCAQWTLALSTSATGSMALGGDQPPVTFSNTQTDSTPHIDSMGFGIGFAASNVNTNQPPLDVWIDDVIVAAAPVTCAD